MSTSGFLTRAEFHAAMAALNFVGCNLEISALFDRYETDGNGRMPYVDFSDKLCGRIPDTAGNPTLRSILAQVRQKVFDANGVYGIRMLNKTLREQGGPPQYNEREFNQFFSHFGIRLDDKEVATIMSEFDSSGSNLVDLQEVLLALRVNLTTKRRALLTKAFQQSGSQAVPLSELVGTYDASQMEMVVSGEIGADQARDDFVMTWDQNEHDLITLDKFIEYFKDVSSAIEDEIDFELMLRNNWHIHDEVDLANNGLDSIQVQVTHTDGHQSTEYVAKDLGISPYDNSSLKAALRRQGINAMQVTARP